LDGIDNEIKDYLNDLAKEYSFSIMAMEVMPDHIHILVDCKPQFFPSDMIKILKGNIARWLFMKHPELKKQLWGGHLWNPSYCIVTASDRSYDQVKQYIDSQKTR
jgi:putative transposase